MAYVDFTITPQPDDTTCGASCLHALYRYYGEQISLEEVMSSIPTLSQGGTLAALLGLHALERGYSATIYTCDVRLFDPSWFEPGAAPLRDQLVAQRAQKPDEKLHFATEAYLRYLAAGGIVRMEDITAGLIAGLLERGHPVLAGLSATWLYRVKRDRPHDNREDPIAGEPLGHFAVVHGLDEDEGTALVADPYPFVPGLVSEPNVVTIERLIGAILLGVITYDAKLLVLEPPPRGA